jgi:hypothetical protein
MLIIGQGAKGDMPSRGILGRGKLIGERKLISIHRVKRFCGPHSVEFTDNTVLDDVDAIIYATGYSADFPPSAIRLI